MQVQIIEEKKAERDFKSAKQDLCASSDLISFNRFLSACLTLACRSTKISCSCNSSGSNDKNSSGVDEGDKNDEGDTAATTLQNDRRCTTEVEAAERLSAESARMTPNLPSSSIFSSTILKEVLEEDDSLSKILRSIPDMVDKKVSCRLGVLSSHCDHPIFSNIATSHAVLSSTREIFQNDGNVKRYIYEKNTRKIESDRFKWYSEPLSEPIDGSETGCQESLSDDLFAVLARHGSRIADTQAAMCSMTG